MNLQQSLNKIRHHISLGEIESAENLTRRLRRKRPSHKEVLFLEGCVQYQKGNYREAIQRFRKLLDKQPDNLEVRMNLAVTLLGAGREEEAASLLLEVTAQQPGNHLAWYNLGNACRILGRNEEARDAYLQVLATEPAYAPACNNLSVVCRQLGDYRQAVAYGRRAVALQADAVFYTNLIIALIGSDLPAAYEAACEALQGEAPPMLQALSFPLMVSCCDWQRSCELLPHLQQAAHGRSVPLGILQDMLLSLNTCSDIAPEVIFDIHRCWGAAISRGKAAVLPAACLPAGDDKLNIGYVSGDFSGHSVGLFMNHVLAAHDAAHFRVHCYASNSGDDDMTRKIRQSVHQYRDIRDMSDEDFAAQVRRDGIHILVDLSGHTRNGRLAAFVLRPAPLQMTWLGYPNSTGLAALDYRISDGYAEAEGGTLYTEELLRLPQSFLCFGAFQERPRQARPPLVERGHVTFGSFNDTRKLTPDVIRTWSAILQQLPDSRLVIKARLAGEAVVQENIRREFARHGIEAQRLELRGFTESREAHLDSYREIDIALDTFPYNGTTTTCEALWMGVPVVTLVGRVHAQRVSYSILKNIGIEETVAETEAAYIEQALALARDPALLEGLRRRIPGAIRNSILCDPQRFTRQLENLYRQAWEAKRHSLPEDIHRDGAEAEMPLQAAKDKNALLRAAQQALREERSHEAASLAQQVLASHPHDIDARFVLGTAEYQRRNFARSCELLGAVAEQAPDFIDARLNLGAALQEVGRDEEAVRHYQAVLTQKPDHWLALNNLGKLYHASLQLAKARDCLERSIAIKKDDWLAWFNLGSVYAAQQDYGQAVSHYRQALALQRVAPVYAGLISALKQVGEFGQAYALARRFIEECGIQEAGLAAFSTFYEACAWDMVARHQPALLELAGCEDSQPRYVSSLLLCLVARPEIDPQTLFQIHRSWGDKVSRVCKPFVHDWQRLENVEKLRIAYLSPDFCAHSVGFFLRHVLAAHDQEHFEIICYSRGFQEDAMGAEMRQAVSRFVDVSELATDDLARMIKDDGIHILVDLAGHTGNSALTVLARRPAPLQMSWLGYPNSTGLAALDYRISDGYAEAEGGTLYTEELLRLPQSFLCFGAFQERPRQARPPLVERGHVTFGSFNDTRKLTPDVIRTWSAILQQLPDSRLVIKARLAGEAVVQENIRREFARHGIEAQRLELRGFTESREAHLDSYREIDIALDTFPYNGTTTTCEALWMGVPVVTLVGRVHAQRVSYSILKNIGIEETVAETEAAYIEQALALARDPALLEGLRRRIPGAIRNSILCDPQRFTRQLEDLYRQAWEDRLAADRGFHSSLLQDNGYGIFQRLPESDVYAPLPEEAECARHDGFLFGAARRRQLAAEGRLLEEVPAEIQPPSLITGGWVEALQGPYALRLRQDWLAYLEQQGESVPWQLHQQALDCHAYARHAASAVQGFYARLYGYRILFQLLQQHASLANLQTFARLALAVGEYENCRLALAQIESLVHSGSVELAEPFLPVVASYDEIAPGRDLREWLLASLGEARRLLPAAEGAVETVPVPLRDKSHSSEARRIRLLHNLARSGGTLIAKCLGCMEGVVLLSEIHPKGSERFNPLQQAVQWFHLFDEQALMEIQARGRLNFIQQLDMIEARCHELGKILVVRDWSHYDFTAVPFAPEPSYRFTTAEVLELSGCFSLLRHAIVRHPIDQWLSLSQLSLVKKQLTLEAFLEGYLRYAEHCRDIGFLRYEDFIAAPGTWMERLCDSLDMPFDANFMDKWQHYETISGEVTSERAGREIRKIERRPLDEGTLDAFATNKHYQAAIGMLGYGHPE